MPADEPRPADDENRAHAAPASASRFGYPICPEPATAAREATCLLASRPSTKLDIIGLGPAHNFCCSENRHAVFPGRAISPLGGDADFFAGRLDGDGRLF